MSEIEYTWTNDFTIEFRRIVNGVRSEDVIATGRRSIVHGRWTFSIVRGERVYFGTDDYVGIEKTLNYIHNCSVGIG